jgi:hypothetical protein
LSGVVRLGSSSRDGDPTLETKGIGLVDYRSGAQVNYDSGGSIARMAFIRGQSEDAMMEGVSPNVLETFTSAKWAAGHEG